MITGNLVEMLARNKQFAAGYKAPVGLKQMASKMMQSRAGIVVLSCSDPRLNPYQILGLDSTLNAVMVRNAGGRVFDAIRTLSVLQTIAAPGTIAIMHHTDCGMTHFHDDDIKKALLELAPGEADSIGQSKYGEITGSIEESIRDDLRLLRASPLIRKDINIVGLKHVIETGLLSEVTLDKSDLPSSESAFAAQGRT